MRRWMVKLAFNVSQVSIILSLLEYLVRQTYWVSIPAVTTFIIFIFVKCSHCGTRLYDDKISEVRIKPVNFWGLFDTRFLDDCPVCHHPMIEK